MTPKTLYWILLAAFALGLSSEYKSGAFPLAHQVAGRAESVFCRTVTRAEQTLVFAGILKGVPGREWSTEATETIVAEQQAQVDRVMAEHQADIQRAMALRQEDLDRIQAQVARAQIVIDRVQAEKLRKLDRVRFSFRTNDANSRSLVYICPKTGKEISIQSDAEAPDLSDLDNDSE